MSATAPPFRLLSPAEYGLLSDQQKRDYLGRLRLDIQDRIHNFRADNRRVVGWLLDRGDMGRRDR